MGHLKGWLNYFIKEFFEVDEIRMRFRPSHFPFTEPLFLRIFETIKYKNYININ